MVNFCCNANPSYRFRGDVRKFQRSTVKCWTIAKTILATFKMLKAPSIWLRRNHHSFDAAGLLFSLLRCTEGLLGPKKKKSEIIPPDASFSTCSLTTGEVRWMLSFRLGSVGLVTIIAASWIDGVMTYFSSVTSFHWGKWEEKLHVSLIFHKYYIENSCAA